MKKTLVILIIFINSYCVLAQSQEIDQEKIEEDFNEIVSNLEKYYIYFSEKNIDLNCIKEYYQSQIKHIKNESETVLFFEYLLDEFYDNHLTLGTTTKSSYRLFAPIYTTIKDGRPFIANVWQTQINKLDKNIIGAEITAFNGVSFNNAIENFPTHCNDKNDEETREWIANKILAGRYNEPRLLTLKLSNNKEVEFDLDTVILKNNEDLLSSKTVDGIGVIRINNSLGNDDLVADFDKTLEKLSSTKGLIIDLRNTIFGGDSYEARGIMSRFITEPKPYQRHILTEKPMNNPEVERNYLEYVSPRLETYTKPVVILVGRWTGSMGEGLAIGFEGMERAEIVGSEMRRLAGEVFDVNFKNQRFGYKLMTTKLFHVNGTIREDYIPTNYVKQTTNERDEILGKGIELINTLNN